MKKTMLSLACVGLSAVLMSGCMGTNNAMRAKNVNPGTVIPNPVHRNAVHPNALHPNTANPLAVNPNRVLGPATTSGNRAVTGTNTGTHAQTARTQAHVLQLGSWLQIVGGTNTNANTGTRGKRVHTNANNPGNRKSNHIVVLTVDDPKAVQAIDRINQVLTNQSVHSDSDTLIKDLHYVLGKAAAQTTAR